MGYTHAQVCVLALQLVAHIHVTSHTHIKIIKDKEVCLFTCKLSGTLETQKILREAGR